MALASLAYPHVRDAELVPPYPSEEHKTLLPPSLHFLCYDYLYYVAAVKVSLFFNCSRLNLDKSQPAF